MYIVQSYDYTDAEQTWFVDAMASGSRWSEPYFDESVGDILMTTYSAVVYSTQADGQRRAVAVVTIDMAIQAIGDAVKRFGLEGNGYAEIVTDSGIYLYSPEQALAYPR